MPTGPAAGPVSPAAAWPTRPAPGDDHDWLRQAPDEEDLVRSYAVDIGAWFSYATAHFGDVIGPTIAFLVIAGAVRIVSYVAGQVVPLANVAIELLVTFPLEAGLTVVCLAQLKGQSWNFGDFFAGFRWWPSLVLVNLMALVMSFLIMLPTVVAIVLALLVHLNKPRGEASFLPILAALGVGLVNGLVLAYLGLRAFLFAVPLILDRGVGPVEALRGSWAITRGHFWGLFGACILLAIINLAGLSACGVGMLLSVPFTFLTWTAGYLSIAGSQPPLPSPAHR